MKNIFLRLHPLFSDYAVLQRGQSMPVRGWAAPETRVTVALAGHKGEAVADASGAWCAILPSIQAEGELELVVQSDRGDR